MPKFRFEHAVLAVIVADTTWSLIKPYLRKPSRAALYEELDRREKMISYLAQLIDDRDVEITEFDLIAINDILNQ